MSQKLNTRSRMDAVQAPIVAIIGDIIRQVPGTISLGQGVVHYGPPPAAVDVARAALSNPETHTYQDGAGSRALIGAIEEKLRRDNAIDVARGGRVTVTAGGNMAFVHAVLAITEPGDEVIVPVPFYFNHEMAIQMAGCTPVCVPTDERYQLDVDAIRRRLTPRTRAVVTVSPNNPTGAVYPEDALREVNRLCGDHGVYHITDEVYEYFTYGSARHVSPACFAGAEQHTISLFSLSKAYGFAGWRIGYMVYPDRLADAVAKVQDTVLVCPPVISQVAAVAAMEVGPAYCRQHLHGLAEVRDIVFAELRSLEPLCTVPSVEGAFYCFMRVNADVDPLRTAERLIREHRVAVMPGPAFGVANGCHFRIAYGALQKQTVAEGIGRLVTGLRAILTALVVAAALSVAACAGAEPPERAVSTTTTPQSLPTSAAPGSSAPARPAPDTEPPVAAATVAVNRERAPLGSPIEMTYRFAVRNDAHFDDNYRVMMHVVNDARELLWTDDHDPAVPTTQWKPGMTVQYARTVFIPVPVRPYVGSVTLQTGLYSVKTQKRLPLANESSGQRAYAVGRLELQPQTANLPIAFKGGWHQAETAADNALVGWRWMKKRGTLAFRNPRKDCLLYLDIGDAGGIFAESQQVQVSIDGSVVDQFQRGPTGPTLRKIRIPAARLGNGDAVQLTIAVDKSFVPKLVAPGVSNDPRELGLRVFHVFVEPAL